jgi:hypothetical protein
MRSDFGGDVPGVKTIVANRLFPRSAFLAAGAGQSSSSGLTHEQEPGRAGFLRAEAAPAVAKAFSGQAFDVTLGQGRLNYYQS